MYYGVYAMRTHICEKHLNKKVVVGDNRGARASALGGRDHGSYFQAGGFTLNWNLFRNGQLKNQK